MEQSRLKSRARRGKPAEWIDVISQAVDEQPETKITKPVAPAKMTLDELRAEMQREAAEVRLANRMKPVLEIQEKKQAKANGMARVADAVKFALGQVEGDDDMQELQMHWRKQ